jgi:hypothetical protein
MSEKDSLQDVSIETPIGKLAAKGVRVSDTIGLLTFVAVALIALALYFHKDDADKATKEFTIAVKEQSQSNKEQAQGLRYMACIVAEDQKDRKNARDSCREQSRLP